MGSERNDKGQFVDGNPGGKGQSTKYREEYVEQAYKICLMGATSEQLADFLDISKETLYQWMPKYPDFEEAIRRGKREADLNVSNSLYRKALGYSHDEDHISNFQGNITKTPIVKHYAPDTTACIFWLKNRQPKEWRDKKEVGHSGSMSITQLLDEIDGKHTGLPPDESD